MNIRNRLISAYLSIILLGLLILMFLSYFVGKSILINQSFEHLTSVRETKAYQIEQYFDDLGKSMKLYAEDQTVKKALIDFNDAFQDLDDTASEYTALRQYYDSIFIPKLNSKSIIQKSTNDFYPENERSEFLQDCFISSNQYDIGKKDELFICERSGDKYSKAHEEFHPFLRNLVKTFGYYDLFLIDTSGNVIYSVFKETDFATNLIHGPYKNSSLSKLFKQTLNSKMMALIDFEAYEPSYNSPASFLGIPVKFDEEIAGILAIQVPVDRIEHIMTGNYQWKEQGLGTSGETYLVGGDLLLRNNSRFFIEDSSAYYSLIADLVASEIFKNIHKIQSTILQTEVNTDAVQDALKGNAGVKAIKDYRDITVFSAYKPLKIEGVNWVILSEIDKSEALQGLFRFMRIGFIFFMALLVMTIWVTFIISTRITKPIVKLSLYTRKFASSLSISDLNEKLIARIEKRSDEIGELGKSFKKLITELTAALTSRDSANKQLKELNDNLENKVLERTNELTAVSEKITLMFDNSADAIITIDEKYKITLFNSAACKIFGYELKEVINQNINILLPDGLDEIHKKHIDSFRNAKDKSRIMGSRLEIKGKRKNGDTFPAEAGISKQEYNGEVFFTAYLRDITKRKEQEEIILASENRFRSMTASALDAIISVNSEGKIQTWNAAAERIFGYSENDMLGKDLELIIPENYRDAHKAGMKRAVDTGEDKIIGKTIELEGQHKSGLKFPIELSLSRWKGKGEYYFSAIIRDITIRKETETLLKRAKERMENELNIARNIQMSMLPLTFPAFPKRDEFDIYAIIQPAREVGGDFYDFYFIEENRFCFAIGDVTGKGVPAALEMAVAKTLISARADYDLSTASILTHVNNEIARNNPNNMFITIFLGIINLDNGELKYSNAGHNPPFIRRANGEIEKLGNLHGPVVGALEGLIYKESKTLLNKDDLIFVYTDGVTEARNDKGILYGEDRLVDLLRHSFDDLTLLMKDLTASIELFEAGTEQSDDITALAIRIVEDMSVTSSTTASYTIKNEKKQIDFIQDKMHEFGELAGIEQTLISKMKIVLDELLTNVIDYGFSDDEVHDIQVEFFASREKLILTLIDDGIPFNPFNISPPDIKLSIEERKIGGLGVHIVKNLMDEYKYKRSIAKNITTLIKYRK